MRFPFSFTRYVGTIPTGGKALGSDSAPSAKAYMTNDNVFAFSTLDEAGRALTKLAACISGPANVSVTVYMWEEATQAWFTLGSAATLATGAMNLSSVTFPSPPANATRGQPSKGIGQGITLAFVATGSSPPNGTYVMAFCPTA